MRDLVVADHGPVRVLRIDRPRALNALSVQLGREMGEALRQADADPAVRAIVVTGTGHRAFSAGGDLKEIATGDLVGEGARIVTRMLRDRPETPMIAAVNGLAYGGGLELVLACDLCVSSEDAIFALSEAARGLLASGGGLVRLPHVVGPRRAAEMALTGEPIDADRALAWGLVNQVVPAADVMPAALRLAQTIARNAPLAVAASKRMIHEASRLSEDEAWGHNEKHVIAIHATHDAREGPRAFAERRPPVWQAR
ncbi:MAG: enoyl-CoA hydratase-related protein [Aeromicrobium sp.]